MTTKEINELLTSACQRYYEWMSDNKKGQSIIEVFQINQGRQVGIYLLKLSSQIFNLDSIAFNFNNEKIYDSSQIKILEYDYDKRVLVIKPTPECVIDFNKVSPLDIQIISDLKFLIERLGEYFKKNGEKIKLPLNAPDIKFNASKFDYLTDSTPSYQQEIALNTIFQNPLTYIWGAPGTGKTRFVLSNCLLKYIRENKRIGIFAPTNVALEQVMNGILEFTDKANIKREKILRIGNPSRKFAQKYPEICEVAGIERQIKQLKKQIQILKGLLGVSDIDLDKNKVENIEEIILNIANLKRENIEITEELTRLKSDARLSSNSIDDLKKSINLLKEKEAKYHNYKSTFFGRILKKLSLNLSYETRIYDIRKVISTKEFLLSEKEDEVSSLQIKIGIHQNKYQKNDEYYQKQKNNLSAINFHHNELNDIWLNNNNEIETLKKLKISLKELINNVERSSLLEDEYKKYPPSVLEQKLNDYISELTKLEAKSLGERIKEVSVIGATLDGFISRQIENDVSFEHVFIDEAAYCNVAKALVVFTLECPVTFLGDHKQLPPVSEMNKTEFNNSYEICLPILQSALYTESFFNCEFPKLVDDFLQNREPVFKNTITAELKESHRFGNNLAQVLDTYVYQNGFTGISEKTQQTEIIVLHADFIKGSKKRENPNEAFAIKNYLETSNDTDFAILAPYNNQVQMIGNLLPEVRNDQRILTVHKSQGQEWSTVIFSVTDTYNMWFVDSTNTVSTALNLINTSVSRAKKKLVIVCDTTYWLRQPEQFIYGLITANNT